MPRRYGIERHRDLIIQIRVYPAERTAQPVVKHVEIRLRKLRRLLDPDPRQLTRRKRYRLYPLPLRVRADPSEYYPPARRRALEEHPVLRDPPDLAEARAEYPLHRTAQLRKRTCPRARLRLPHDHQIRPAEASVRKLQNIILRRVVALAAPRRSHQYAVSRAARVRLTEGRIEGYAYLIRHNRNSRRAISPRRRSSSRTSRGIGRARAACPIP